MHRPWIVGGESALLASIEQGGAVTELKRSKEKNLLPGYVMPCLTAIKKSDDHIRANVQVDETGNDDDVERNNMADEDNEDIVYDDDVDLDMCLDGQDIQFSLDASDKPGVHAHVSETEYKGMSNFFKDELAVWKTSHESTHCILGLLPTHTEL